MPKPLEFPKREKIYTNRKKKKKRKKSEAIMIIKKKNGISNTR